MTSITISSDVLAQEMGGETVLLDLAGENYFGLDAVSTRAWQLLQTGASQAEVVDALFEHYEVERDVLEKDIEELLHSLSEAGLIKIG